MGFGKIKKEVEASGLDPQVAHSDLTVEGKLVGIVDVPSTITTEQLEDFKNSFNKEISEPSAKALKVLEAANEGLVAAVSELHNKGIPLHGLDADGNLVTEEPSLEQVEEETEAVEESPKTAKSEVKEKKAPTKKKPTKK